MTPTTTTGLRVPPLTKNVQIILLGLATLFALQAGLPQFDAFVHSQLLVSAWAVIGEYRIWTPVTSVLWHDGISHLLMNALALFFFAGHVDSNWSTKRFWSYCLICAVGSGLTVVLWQSILAVVLSGGLSVLTGEPQQFLSALRATSAPTLGFSGVVMGLLAAFAYFMWDRQFHLFVFPVTGKVFFFLLIAFDLFRVCGGSPVSISGHMGGLLVGFAVTHVWFSDPTGPLGGRRPEASDFQRELLASARDALEAEDWNEAYRLCHQLRSTSGNLPQDVLDEVWEILAVSTTYKGAYDEAESYLDRAPETAQVEEARRHHRHANDAE
jgi:membrane associated rhomboid family serine protease